MSSAPIILFLGCGSNIGANVAEAFIALACNIALVSSTMPEEKSTPTELHKGRLFRRQLCAKIFEEAKEKFGRRRVRWFTILPLNIQSSNLPIKHLEIFNL
jgi:NAD(P)-dependent dehydrogenase (short-subunit alcohol dehydrogenase family)